MYVAGVVSHDIGVKYAMEFFLLRHHYKAKTLIWNLKGYLQTVFFVWKLVENKMFQHISGKVVIL